MSKIPTAEEFLQNHLEISHFYDDKTNQMVCFSADVEKAMIEFAIEQLRYVYKELFITNRKFWIEQQEVVLNKIQELEQKLSEL